MEHDSHVSTVDLVSEIHRLESYSCQRQSQLLHELVYSAYGHSVTCRVSDPILLSTPTLSAGRFSRCDPISGADPILLDFFIDPKLTLEPVPADLASRLAYRFAGRYLTVTGQDWIRAIVHVDRNVGVALVSPTVATRPYFLSRYICDNLVLHLLMRNGVGTMGHLHASCLHRDGTALLLCGPHGAGKSTTGVRLLEYGYQLVSDSSTFARMWRGGMELLGYPVGELRLRLDTVDAIPRLGSGGRAAMVRDETKLVYNLREIAPEWVAERSIWPDRILFCQIKRSSEPATRAHPASAEELLEEIWPESVFVDDPEVNDSNLTTVRSLLEQASTYRVCLGSLVSQLQSVFERL